MRAQKTTGSARGQSEPLHKPQARRRSHLSDPIGVSLLGIDLNIGMYLNNPFRFVGTRADVDPVRLDEQKQRLRNATRLEPTAWSKACIQTGYDDELAMAGQEAVACVSRLRDPRQRLVSEFFWLHVPEATFNHMLSEKTLACHTAVETLRGSAAKAKGREGALAQHALAVICHNQAIATELSYNAGQCPWPEDRWKEALMQWSAVLTNKHFWAYIEDRVKTLSDSRLRLQDLDTLREELPKGILAFNGYFARLHAQNSKPEACGKHIEILNRSAFSNPLKQEIQLTVVRSLTKDRLAPLVRRAGDPEAYEASQPLTGKQKRRRVRCPQCGGRLREISVKGSVTEEVVCPRCDIKEDKCPFCKSTLHAAKAQQCLHCGRSWYKCVQDAARGKPRAAEDGRYPRPVFEEIYGPVLEEAQQILESLRLGLGISDELLRDAQFDSFCDVLRKVVDEKLVCNGDDGPRARLYSLLLTKMLLGFPVSSGMRMKLEQVFKSTIKSLYGDLKLPQDLDPTVCSFLPGEAADPDASLVWPMFKITKVRGGNVGWTTLQMLIPRSHLAAQVHAGKLSPDQLCGLLKSGQTCKIKDEIQRVKEHRDSEVGRTTEKYAQEERKRAAQEVEATKKHQTAAANEDTTRQQAIQKVKAEHAAKLNHHGDEYRKARHETEHRFSEELKVAMLASQKAKLGARTLKRWVGVVLPIAILTAGLGGAAVFSLVHIGVMSPDGVVSVMTRIGQYIPESLSNCIALSPGIVLIAVGATLGFVVGLLTGNSIRRREVRRCHRTVREVRARCDGTLKSLEADYSQKVKTNKNAEKAAIASAQQAVSQEIVKHAGAKKAVIAKRTQLKKECEAAIAKIHADAGARIKSLERQMRTDNLVKPESTKTAYPAYESARKDGYEDGQKPSDSRLQQIAEREMQRFMDSLSDEEKIALSFMAKLKGQDEFAQFLGVLMTMSPHVRKETLRKLAPLGSLGLFGRGFGGY